MYPTLRNSKVENMDSDTGENTPFTVPSVLPRLASESSLENEKPDIPNYIIYGIKKILFSA